jgi:hypothetical protein
VRINRSVCLCETILWLYYNKKQGKVPVYRPAPPRGGRGGAGEGQQGGCECADTRNTTRVCVCCGGWLPAGWLLLPACLGCAGQPGCGWVGGCSPHSPSSLPKHLYTHHGTTSLQHKKGLTMAMTIADASAVAGPSAPAAAARCSGRRPSHPLTPPTPLVPNYHHHVRKSPTKLTIAMTIADASAVAGRNAPAKCCPHNL